MTARPGTTENLPPDHEERRRILVDLDSTMLVEAAAGTGKTTSMVGRMVALIREGKCPVETMAAITFTRKAAAELRSRFQVELERAAREASGEAGERLARAVSRIERCFIGTVHSFCGRLLRERPIEAGVDLAFEEMEEDEDLLIRERGWDEYVAGLYSAGSPLLEELRDLGLEIDRLRERFIRFADFPDVERWPAGHVELGDLDEVRRELEDYLRHLDGLVRTLLPDYGSDDLMPACERVVRMARNRDLTRPTDLMAVLEEFEKTPKVTQKCWPGGREQALEERARWEEFSVSVARPLIGRWREKRYELVMVVFHQALVVYNSFRALSGRLNFQDLLMNATGLLRGNPQIRRYFRARFTHLLVDEFQDTDPIQAEVMMYLAAADPTETDWRKCTPVPGSLFVVGDPKQSIYRFRRADIVTYSQVKKLIRGSGGSIVPLTANFRTRSELISWHNRVFEETFPEEASPHSPAFRRMEVGREEGAEGELAGLRVLEVPGGLGRKDQVIPWEADIIARTIRRALDTGMTVPRTRREIERGKGPEAVPGDFMIITRRKAELAFYAQKLQELGIQHEVSGGSALGQVTEIRLLADCLRAVTEPENAVSLVAVLRGGLFGLSDRELYEYRRAGGEFSYRAPVPEGLDPETARLFRDAFDRLIRYDRWLKRLPPVPAIERIATDLGLPMRALSRAGGSVQAGSIVKMFQLLRASGAGLHSVADLTAYLAELVENDAEFDGIPARPHETSAVRLMNLHRVKGLEAPIVFLANPTGKWNPPVGLHVDRSGGSIDGYMAVHESSGSFSRRLLAIPPGWEELEAEEKRFADAEENRLLYVAATRAGSLLVIPRWNRGRRYNYWDFFSPYLEEAELMPDPGPQEAPAGLRVRLTPQDAAGARAAISEAWQPVVRPTYRRGGVKELAVGARAASGITAGEHGTEWGTVIHVLLEAAMRNPGADLAQVARAAVEEQGLDSSYAERATETVESVMRSEIWRRAMASGRHLVEVPFITCRGEPEEDRTVHQEQTEGDGAARRMMREDGQALHPSEAESDRTLPLVLRGAIDLVFREEDGWVVVDYKTDAAPAGELPALVEHYRGQVLAYRDAWEEITGERVKETGLYFTSAGKYLIVE